MSKNATDLKAEIMAWRRPLSGAKKARLRFEDGLDKKLQITVASKFVRREALRCQNPQKFQPASLAAIDRA